MHVAPTEKFGAFFLSRCGVSADLPQEEEIEPSVWMSRRLGMDIAQHWRTWLGSLQTDEMGKDGLGMYVTARSASPEVNDGENVTLYQRAQDLLNGLLLQGVPWTFDDPRSRGVVVHGVNINGVIQIRGWGGMERHYCTVGLNFDVGMAEVRRSLALAERPREIKGSSLYWARLLRGIRTLLLANRQSNEDGDRVHQFVRALEAVIKPRVGGSRNDFAHRGQTLALNNADTREVLLELYGLRSHVEHLNVPTDTLQPGGTEEQRRERVNRRTRQADVLARSAFLRILESPDLLDRFRTDDQIDAFWGTEHGDRVRLWGERLDIVGIP